MPSPNATSAHSGPTFSVADLSVRYGVNEQTVLGWIKTGELKAINVGRRMNAKKPRWRITQEAVTAFEELRTPKPIARRTRQRRQTDDDVIHFYT